MTNLLLFSGYATNASQHESYLLYSGRYVDGQFTKSLTIST